MSTTALHSTLNIWETVTNRGLVPKDHQYEMAYGLSKAHVTEYRSRHMTLKGQTHDPNTAQYLENYLS